MKKLLPLLALSSLLMSCGPTSTTPTPTDSTGINGVWKGEYACGDALLTLDLKEVNGEQVTGVFNFAYYASSSTKSLDPARQGSFNLSGTFKNDILDLKAGSWINKPVGTWYTLDVLTTYDPVKNQFVGSLPKSQGGPLNDACLKVTLTR